MRRRTRIRMKPGPKRKTKNYMKCAGCDSIINGAAYKVDGAYYCSICHNKERKN